MQNPTRIMAAIVATETHRIYRTTYLSRMIAGTLALLVLSLYGNYLIATKDEVYRYILTRPDGVLTDITPLNERKHENQYIVDWTTDKIIKSLTFDFANYRTQFQEIQKNMTVYGWQEFLRAMETSGNMRAVIGNSYVTTAVPTGPGEIVKEGLLLDRFVWRVRIPILLTYQSSLRRTTQDLVLEVVTARMPEWVNPEGLGIRQVNFASR